MEYQHEVAVLIRFLVEAAGSEYESEAVKDFAREALELWDDTRPSKRRNTEGTTGKGL